jgi:hypothetical protein
MAQSGFLTLIYGVVLAVAIFFFIQMLYSVYYTPGSTTLYNSPITQQLFPSAMNKMFPTWGYNKAGMYDGQPFKFGQGEFWPESGKGFVPNKYASGGPSPDGGLRSGGGSIPEESPIGYWGYSPEPRESSIRNIYDNSSQHVEYDTPIGWWGN